MNSFRCSFGFSLIEVLVSCVVLSLAAIGITASWRLADYKALLTRLDHRADRILREYYELQTFAPKGAKPLTDTPPEKYAPEDSRSGYLYHPLRLGSSKMNPQYDDLISYTVGHTNGAEAGTSELTLIYTVPGYGSEAAKSFTKTIMLNPLPTPTP